MTKLSKEDYRAMRSFMILNSDGPQLVEFAKLLIWGAALAGVSYYFWGLFWGLSIAALLMLTVAVKAYHLWDAKRWEREDPDSAGTGSGGH